MFFSQTLSAADTVRSQRCLNYATNPRLLWLFSSSSAQVQLCVSSRSRLNGQANPACLPTIPTNASYASAYITSGCHLRIDVHRKYTQPLDNKTAKLPKPWKQVWEAEL